jgi:hypothetical protein
LSSGIFLGSAILYASNELAGITGIAASILVLTIFTIFRKH